MFSHAIWCDYELISRLQKSKEIFLAESIYKFVIFLTDIDIIT